MDKGYCLYLHIGMPKTGTTSIQGYLAANSKSLAAQGFFYDTTEQISVQSVPVAADLQAARYMNGHWILESLEEASKKLCQRTFFGIANLDEKLLERLAAVDFAEYSVVFTQHIAALDRLLKTQNVILSNEWLWLIPQVYLRQLHRYFADRIKVIVYLRRQDYLVESAYNHAIRKSAMAVSFDDFQGLFGVLPYMKKTLCYRQRLDEIREIIGRENLIARVYGRNDPNGNRFDIKKDFADIIGLDDKRLRVRNNKNTRISGQLIEYLRAFHSIIDELPQDRRPSRERVERITDILCDISGRGGPDLYFAPEARKKFLAAYEEENAYIANNYLDGVPLSDEGHPPDTEATVHPLSEEEMDKLRFVIALALS